MTYNIQIHIIHGMVQENRTCIHSTSNIRYKLSHLFELHCKVHSVWFMFWVFEQRPLKAVLCFEYWRGIFYHCYYHRSKRRNQTHVIETLRLHMILIESCKFENPRTALICLNAAFRFAEASQELCNKLCITLTMDFLKRYTSLVQDAYQQRIIVHSTTYRSFKFRLLVSAKNSRIRNYSVRC